jgi:HPt (histidine-containing phosphotransfer) domain-containing protein
MADEDRIVVTVDADLEDLIPGFLENRRKDVLSLHEALVSGDIRAIQSIGHNLKGVGGGYGFPEISEIGAQIEACAKQNDASGIRQHLARLEDYLVRVEVVYQ